AAQVAGRAPDLLERLGDPDGLVPRLVLPHLLGSAARRNDGDVVVVVDVQPDAAQLPPPNREIAVERADRLPLSGSQVGRERAGGMSRQADVVDTALC